MLPRTSLEAILVLLSLVVHAGADCIWSCAGETFPWKFSINGQDSACGLTSVCSLNTYCGGTTPNAQGCNDNFGGAQNCINGGNVFCSNDGCGYGCQPCPSFSTRAG
jgi:hypothetical protein